MALTDTAENRALDWTVGNAATAPVGAMKLALYTVAGTDSTAGTEVVGGSYARATITLAATAGGATSNGADVTIAGMPACTVVAWAIWDSAGVPIRWWHGALTASKVVNTGDDFVILAGDLDLTLD